MRFSWLFVIALFFLIIGIFSFTEKVIPYSDITVEKENIRLRNIGHQLLLKTGDKTSRVLPIESYGENEYRIRFESILAIDPDTLVGIVQNNLTNSQFPPNYMVQVQKCISEQVVHTFYYDSSREADDMIPCRGRLLQEDCYLLRIVFEEPITEMVTNDSNWHGPLAMLMAGMTFLLGVWRIRKPKPEPAKIHIEEKPVTNEIAIDGLRLYPEEQYLLINDEKIQLTEKETHLLKILTAHPNQVVERSRLREEVWGDDGEMISRSLDMFISKLRKKIKPAENLEIINIRGKGWKLKVSK